MNISLLIDGKKYCLTTDSTWDEATKTIVTPKTLRLDKVLEKGKEFTIVLREPTTEGKDPTTLLPCSLLSIAPKTLNKEDPENATECFEIKIELSKPSK